MPKSSKSKIVNFYQQAAVDLKRLGVVNYPDPKNLSRGQKSYLTKFINSDAYKELIHAVKKPEEFHMANVGKKTAKELKESGYKVTRLGKAIIPKKEFSKVEIQKGAIKYTGTNRAGEKITEKVTLVSAKNFHSKLLSIAQKPLKKNQMLTIKIGDNAAFNTRFQSYADLHKYLTMEFKPNPGKNGKKQTVAQLMRHISIVEIEKVKRSGKEKNTKANLTRK